MSYELICFHASIIRPLARPYVMVGSLSSLSHSSYGIPLTLSTILVALFWTFSIACNCLLLIKPPQTASPNSRCWRTNALYNGITISVVQQVKLLLMRPSILFSVPSVASMCDSKVSSESMIIPQVFLLQNMFKTSGQTFIWIRLNNVPPYFYRRNNTFPRMELQEPSF